MPRARPATPRTVAERRVLVEHIPAQVCERCAEATFSSETAEKTRLLLPGCAGWQIGNRSLYRPDIATVHVPIVRSDSYRRNLGERLTEMIVKEIELKTPYKVVDAASADSVLAVRIASESKKVLSETRNDDVRDMETDFFVQMSWSDRRGDLISGGGRHPYAPLLVNNCEQENFVPEGGQSLTTAQQATSSRGRRRCISTVWIVRCLLLVDWIIRLRCAISRRICNHWSVLPRRSMWWWLLRIFDQLSHLH